MSARAESIHYARAMLAEASRRRHHPQSRDFYWLLLRAAVNARKAAAAVRTPAQGGLFA